MSGRLDILAAGMVTAVGLDAASSCAAMRARLDGFQDTRFLGPGGEWQVGAPVPMPHNWIGEKRLAHMAAAAICEIFEKIPEAEGKTDLIFCLPEERRPGRLIADGGAFARRIGEIISVMPRTPTRLVAYGRPSGSLALDRARRMLTNGADYILIVGVDSYLTSRSIAHYLAEERLLTPQNSNGFIPGEAAAAILCSARHSGALTLAGLGLVREEAFLYNRLDEDRFDLPLRADGMTSAYKMAFNEAGCRHSDIVLKIGDQIGESFWFKQTALAMLRTQRERSDVQPIWAIGASLGNIGAAVVPVMLAWALAAVQKGYVPSGPILIEASSDDGACGALVMEAT